MSLYPSPIRYVLRNEQHHEFRVEIRLGNDLTNVDATVAVEIFDANNVSMVTGVATADGTGIYYYLYQIPSTPTSGTWMITFSYAVGGKSSVEKQRFEVSSISPVLATPTDLTPTVDNIRNFLSLNKTTLTDPKILLHIKVARVTIDYEKSYYASAENIEEAVFFAACLSVINVVNKENDNLAESTFADAALVTYLLGLYKLAMRKVKRIFDSDSKFDVSAEVGDTRSSVL